MGNLALVTVLMPTYNHQNYIRKAIESVLIQSYSNWELLILDDGSTDDTLSIAKSYLDSRIRIISRLHAGIEGLADLYNMGLGESKGDFISILEADDLWANDTISLQLGEIMINGVVMSYGRVMKIWSDGSEDREHISWVRRLDHNILFNRPVGTSLRGLLNPQVAVFSWPCTIMLKKSALIAIGGFKQWDGVGTVDWPTLIQISLVGEFRFIDSILGYWRRHRSAATFTLSEKFLIGCMNGTNEFMKLNVDLIKQFNIGNMDKEWMKILSRNAAERCRVNIAQGDIKSAKIELTKVVGLSARILIIKCILFISIHLGQSPERLFKALKLNSLEMRD